MLKLILEVVLEVELELEVEVELSVHYIGRFGRSGKFRYRMVAVSEQYRNRYELVVF